MRSMLVIGATLDDARDFIGRDFMGRIDNVAPRKLAIPDEIWPRDETMTAEFCTPDTIPMRAFDIVVLTARLPDLLAVHVLASARVAKGGALWREAPALAGFAAGGSFAVPGHGPAMFTATPGERVQAPRRPALPSPSDGTSTHTPGGSFTVPIDGGS